MNPYAYYREMCKEGSNNLDLMSGNGFCIPYITNDSFTFVDVYQPYLNSLIQKKANARTACIDSVEFLKNSDDKSFDVVSCIDGLEHLTKERGLELLKEMERVAKKKIYIFTPEAISESGMTHNAPVDTWGIKGGDEYQKHLSGWKLAEMESLGYKLINTNLARNAYDGSQYHERMYVKVFE